MCSAFTTRKARDYILLRIKARYLTAFLAQKEERCSDIYKVCFAYMFHHLAFKSKTSNEKLIIKIAFLVQKSPNNCQTFKIMLSINTKKSERTVTLGSLHKFDAHVCTILMHMIADYRDVWPSA